MTKYKLGEICTIVSGSTPKTTNLDYWNGDKKWITPAEITDNTYIVKDTERKLTELGVKATGLTICPKGTVLLSSRAPIGKVAIAGVDMYCNQGFKNLICSELVENRFLYWFLKGKTNFLNSLGRGATFKEISKHIVENIEIELPDKKQQIKVAELFESIHNIMELYKQTIDAFDTLTKARLKPDLSRCLETSFSIHLIGKKSCWVWFAMYGMERTILRSTMRQGTLLLHQKM